VDPSRILWTSSDEYLLRTPDGLDEGEFVMPVGGEKVRIPEWKMNSMAQDDGRVTYKEVSDQFNEAGANRGDIRNELQNSRRSCGGNVCTAMVSETTGAPTADGPNQFTIAEYKRRTGEILGENIDNGDSSVDGSGGATNIEVENSSPYSIDEIDIDIGNGDVDVDTGGLKR